MISDGNAILGFKMKAFYGIIKKVR